MEYVKELNKDIQENKDKSFSGTPLSRLEPNTVMVDFIRHITSGEDRICGDLYLGECCDDGDNSDNGHYEICLLNGNAIHF